MSQSIFFRHPEHRFSEQMHSSNSRRIAGFSLIELLIVMVIIAILTAVALPSYRKYVLRTNRATVRTFLVDVAAKEEGYFLQAHTYSTSTFSTSTPVTLTASTTAFMPILGASASTVWIDANSKNSTAITSTSIYQVTLSATTTGTTTPNFTLTATPVNNQFQDTQCPSFTLNDQGIKTPTPGVGTTGDCWGR